MFPTQAFPDALREYSIVPLDDEPWAIGRLRPRDSNNPLGFHFDTFIHPFKDLRIKTYVHPFFLIWNTVMKVLDKPNPSQTIRYIQENWGRFNDYYHVVRLWMKTSPTADFHREVPQPTPFVPEVDCEGRRLRPRGLDGLALTEAQQKAREQGFRSGPVSRRTKCDAAEGAGRKTQSAPTIPLRKRKRPSQSRGGRSPGSKKVRIS